MTEGDDSELTHLLGKIREGAIERDVRGDIACFLGIVRETDTTLEAAGSSRQELAELTMIGIMSEAVRHLEMLKTLHVAGLSVTEVEVREAESIIKDALVPSNDALRHELSPLEAMEHIFGTTDEGAEEPTLSDEGVVSELRSVDPFAQAEARQERGDTTIEFLVHGTTLPAEEALAEKCACADRVADEGIPVTDDELVEVRSLPPPLPKREQQAAGSISLQA